MAPLIAPAPKPVSQKHKNNIDGLDPANVINTTRERKVHQKRQPQAGCLPVGVEKRQIMRTKA
jgi:hypothetical protein